MSSYFILTGQEQQNTWNDYRVEWMKHRDAVLAFMEKVGGEEVRTNHVGAPIAVRFKHGIILPQGFRQTTWGPTGAHLINMKGEKLYADDIKDIAALYPKLPVHIAKQGHFDLDPNWHDENSPIYLVTRHDVTDFMRGAGGYREITETEFKFRMALDAFRAEDTDRCDAAVHWIAMSW